jgi:hypothetical protein
MSAIGINVSTRDQVHGWESVQPKHHTPACVRYIEARGEAEAMWAEYYKYWSDCGNQEETDRFYSRCELAQSKADLLHKQAECPHRCIEWEGGATTYRGEPDESYRPVCRDCGAVIE